MRTARVRALLAVEIRDWRVRRRNGGFEPLKGPPRASGKAWPSHGRALYLALLVALVGAGAAAAAAGGDSVSFAGKLITATIGFEAGNRVDLYGRTLVRRMKVYLPGEPNFIVMNRPGAGGVVALNEWVARADPSGLNVTIGGESQIDEDALSRTHAKYKPEKFRYIGGLVAPSQGLFINKQVLANLYNKSKRPVTMGIVARRCERAITRFSGAPPSWAGTSNGCRATNRPGKSATRWSEARST